MDDELKDYLERMERRIVASVEARVRQVESRLVDGQIVTNGMVDRHSYTLQEHEMWLRDHTRALARHQEFIERHQEFIEQHEAIMRKIDRNIEALTELILRGRGSNGNPPEQQGR